MKKLEAQSLLYVFYNFTHDSNLQLEAARNLYDKGWVYNYQEYLWFEKLDLNSMQNPRFFNMRKWEMTDYPYQNLKREAFARFEDIEANAHIHESSGNGNNSSVHNQSGNSS